MSKEIFMVGDPVYYTGTKFAGELSGKGGMKAKGWIHASVVNEPGVWVVEFLDLKQPDFIIHESNLRKAAVKSIEEAYEVAPRRKKSEEDLVK